MELYKELGSRGFAPVAAASFVCQHTYLSDLAAGRPDEKDMAVVKEFGDKIKERLRLAVLYDMKKLDIPGSYPYEKPPMTQFPFNVETNEYCIYCMLCAGVCPMKAISDSNPRDINNDVCRPLRRLHPDLSGSGQVLHRRSAGGSARQIAAPAVRYETGAVVYRRIIQ